MGGSQAAQDHPHPDLLLTMNITIQEYAQRINTLAKKYPNATLIYSADDEGNAYNELFTLPHVGNFSDEGEFDTESDEINAVCIN